jgi:hypothetical protein
METMLAKRCAHRAIWQALPAIAWMRRAAEGIDPRPVPACESADQRAQT